MSPNDRRGPDLKDAGYVSAVAIMVSLAIAIVAIAFMARATAALKLARTDFEKTQAEYLLAGAQVLAAQKILAGIQNKRLTWSQQISDATIEVLAEPEAAKANLAKADKFDERSLSQLGAQDPQAAKAALAALGGDRIDPEQIEAIDDTPEWRRCASSAISSWGTSSALKLEAPSAPKTESLSAGVGQIWRVQVISASGWVDDRVERLTGDGRQPSAIIWRRFVRRKPGSRRCDVVLTASQ